MLVSQHGCFSVDEEPYKNGERSPKGTPDYIETDDIELTGHWCNNCRIMVTFHANLTLPKAEIKFYVEDQKN